MKVPRTGSGAGPETIVGFETEHRLLPLLTGPHVPRFVACGALAVHPYLVIEQVPGRTYQELLDQMPRLDVDRAVAMGIEPWRGPAIACTVRTWCIRTVKPANVMWRDGGIAVLLDFLGCRTTPSCPICWPGRDAPADRHPRLHGARAGARHSR